MKKIIISIFSLFIFVCSFAICDEAKKSVVCTIFPEYDWVCQLLGTHTDDVDVTMLINKGVDLHSYQPSASDILKISNCDMFIYVGGESDEWVEAALSHAQNKNMVVVNLLDCLADKAKVETAVEGMQQEDEEAEADEKDEHVWLSLKNADVLCRVISEKLQEIDDVHKDDYAKNCDDYLTQLSVLDDQYKDVVQNSSINTLVFADRFPFRYLVDDYGLNYFAAFKGCSAETEASFKTIAFLSKKIDELNLKNVLTIEGAKHRIAETVIKNTKLKNQKILVMDSMQSKTSADVKNGATYISVMKKNLEVLRSALK